MDWCGKLGVRKTMPEWINARRIAIVKATVLLFTLLLLSHHPPHFPHSAFKGAFLKRKTKRHFKSKVALFQTSSPQCSIFGVSFRRVLPSWEKGKESKMSFAYASIKSKIRKFQVVLECTAKRITECLLPCDLHTSEAVVVIAWSSQLARTTRKRVIGSEQVLAGQRRAEQAFFLEFNYKCPFNTGWKQ